MPTFFVIVSPDLVPLICADLRFVRRALRWRVAGCCLTGTTRLCSCLQSLETKVLHARLLLAVVSHAEGAVA